MSEDLVDWEEKMVKRMMEEGLSEEEAWRRVERIHMELTKEDTKSEAFVKELVELAEDFGFELGDVLSYKEDYCGGHLIMELKKEGDLEKLKKETGFDDVNIIDYKGIKALGFWWVNC